ncbi:hypothetical protein C0J52_24766, partial [Blattella germanica]
NYYQQCTDVFEIRVLPEYSSYYDSGLKQAVNIIYAMKDQCFYLIGEDDWLRFPDFLLGAGLAGLLRGRRGEAQGVGGGFIGEVEALCIVGCIGMMSGSIAVELSLVPLARSSWSPSVPIPKVRSTPPLCDLFRLRLRLCTRGLPQPSSRSVSEVSLAAFCEDPLLLAESVESTAKASSRMCPYSTGYGGIQVTDMPPLKQVPRLFFLSENQVLLNLQHGLKSIIIKIMGQMEECEEVWLEELKKTKLALHCLSNLSVLNINSNIDPQIICRSIKYLTKLEIFEYPKYSTNNIIKEISRNCPKLKKLNVGYSDRIGHQLKKLQLLFVENLNMSSIIKYCINLEFLSLGACTISDIANNIDIESPHFTSVKELILFSNTEGEKWFDVILPYYKNLQVFLSSNMDELDDEFFENALKRGSFSHVQTFIINYSSKRGVFLLLKYCPELKKLGLLEGTQKIETDFISEIKTLIKQQLDGYTYFEVETLFDSNCTKTELDVIFARIP